MSTGIAMFAYNYVIMRQIGVEGVTAFTIVGYVAYVFSMVVVGFGQGAGGIAGLYIRTSDIFWHDGRMACGSGDGGDYDLYQHMDGAARRCVISSYPSF